MKGYFFRHLLLGAVFALLFSPAMVLGTQIYLFFCVVAVLSVEGTQAEAAAFRDGRIHWSVFWSHFATGDTWLDIVAGMIAPVLFAVFSL